MENIQRYLLLFIVIFLGTISQCLASSETFRNQVTIEVPSYLFIEGDQKDVRLTFSDYKLNSETNTQTIAYKIMGNSMKQSDGAPAITARLDGNFTDIDFQARVGTYTKESGNAELRGVSSDFVSIGESETALAQKANSTGDGLLLRGKIEVTYKAVATSSLQAGEYPQGLTLTLTDV